MATGYGKVILLGEHAVVYGYPALASALPCGVTLEAAPGALSVRVPSWELDVDVAASPAHPVARALVAVAGAVAARAARELPAAALRGDAQLWPAAGLGSSGALCVAIARALAAAAQVELSDAEIAEVANRGEQIFHGSPSGLDVALAASGRAGVFRRGRGLTPVRLRPLTLVIGHSGEPRSTARMVARVAEQTGGDPADARLLALADATSRGVEAATTGARADLGLAMRDAQRVLAELGVSTPRLDALCTAAEGAGALGAKLTGAGGGGCAIALVADDAAPVVDAWQRLGARTRVEVLG
ncbi:MAG: mevalonate kinase [Kofleriaceae bacterium]